MFEGSNLRFLLSIHRYKNRLDFIMHCLAWFETDSNIALFDVVWNWFQHYIV